MHSIDWAKSLPRKPRYYLPGIPAHVVQRGNCRQAVFYADEDYQRYLDWLIEGASRHGCQIHAYVLMSNHVHLLMTPDTSDSISKLIQFVGRNYVTYVNRRYHKSGTLWEGRHKGCLVANDDYFLACMRYIELNPVRAGMVEHPSAYDWSSYRINATGAPIAPLSPHRLYQLLGQDKDGRASTYRELFSQCIASDCMLDIRATVQTGTPLGNQRFREQVETILQCKVGQSRRGRPNG